MTDDELVNRVVISAMLTSLGYRVLEAADGYEALALLDSEAIDAVTVAPPAAGVDLKRACAGMREAYDQFVQRRIQ